MSHKCFSSRFESHFHLMPLNSPWGHAFLGSLLSCRDLCSFIVGKKCNLPLGFPLCSSVVPCVGSVVPLFLPPTFFSPQKSSLGKYHCIAFSRVYSLAFETGTLHIGVFCPCQITFFLMQSPEPGAITCGESGDFKRTLYWEKHCIEREACKHRDASHIC